MLSSHFSLIVALLAFDAHVCLARSLYNHPSLQRQEQSLLGLWDVGHARFRKAEEKDAADITTVIYDAFSPGGAAKYVHLPGDGYKKEEWKCMRKQVKKALRGKSNTTFFNVIAVPRKSGHHSDTEDLASEDYDPRQGNADERVVAVAGWALLEPNSRDNSSATLANLAMMDCGLQHTSIHSQQGDASGRSTHMGKCSDNPGINMTRADDLGKQLAPAMEKYITSLDTPQMYLTMLATHPEWDGHGFGARHCHWGMSKARHLGVPNTLIATPAGFPLYESLGFEAVANITAEMLDGLGQLWWEYMRYDW